MNNEQLYKDFEALNKEASLGGGLNRIEKQHACGRIEETIIFLTC